jgi:hypothetical protein
MMRQPEFCLLHRIRDTAGCREDVVERDKGCGTRHSTDAEFRDRITQLSHSRPAVERQKVLYWLLFAFGFRETHEERPSPALKGRFDLFLCLGPDV